MLKLTKYVNKICPIFPFLVSYSWHIFIYMVIIIPESLVLSLSMNGLCTVLTASEHAELFCDVILPLTFRTFRGFFLPYWLKFLSILRTSFLTSYKTELVEIYSLGFWLSDNVFISTKFPKNSLLGIRLLVDNFPFLLSVVKISSHSLLACRISAKK